MGNEIDPIPEGLNNVTPHMMLKGGVESIYFYKKAFGACLDWCYKESP